MLETIKTVTLNGSSMVGGAVLQGYQAQIDSVNPDNIVQMTNWISDQKAYREHRAECRRDAAAFEDAVYELQDQMVAEKAAREG